MYILSAEKRNPSVKAKQLRKSGLVPVNVCGGDLKEALLLQVSRIDAGKLLKFKTKGGRVTLDFDGNKVSALLKEISANPVNGQIDNLTFQKLLEDEIVNSTVKIVLINKDKTQLMVQQMLDEIPYRALPSDLVEQLEIAIDEMKGATILKVEDLPFAKNEKIEILIPTDTLILTLLENQKVEEPISEGAEN